MRFNRNFLILTQNTLFVTPIAADAAAGRKIHNHYCLEIRWNWIAEAGAQAQHNRLEEGLVGVLEHGGFGALHVVFAYILKPRIHHAQNGGA